MLFVITKLSLEHFSVLKAGVLDNVLTEEKLIKFTFFDVKHSQTKSEVSLGFIADKITKEKFFKKGVTAGDVMDSKYGI